MQLPDEEVYRDTQRIEVFITTRTYSKDSGGRVRDKHVFQEKLMYARLPKPENAANTTTDASQDRRPTSLMTSQPSESHERKVEKMEIVRKVDGCETRLMTEVCVG